MSHLSIIFDRGNEILTQVKRGSGAPPQPGIRRGRSLRPPDRSAAPREMPRAEMRRSPSAPPCFGSDRAASPAIPSVGVLDIPHLGCGGRRVNYG